MNTTMTTAPKEVYRTKLIDKTLVELSRKQAMLEGILRGCGRRHGSAMHDEIAHQCIVASRVCNSAFVALSRARASTLADRAGFFKEALSLSIDIDQRQKQIAASLQRAERRDRIA